MLSATLQHNDCTSSTFPITLFLHIKLQEATHMFVIVDCVKNVPLKKSCKYGEYESFEHLLLFPSSGNSTTSEISLMALWKAVCLESRSKDHPCYTRFKLVTKICYWVTALETPETCSSWFLHPTGGNLIRQLGQPVLSLPHRFLGHARVLEFLMFHVL